MGKFTESQIENFKPHAEDSDDRSNRATHHLRKLAKVLPTLRHSQLVRRFGHPTWIPQYTSGFVKPVEVEDYRDEPPEMQPDNSLMLIGVEVGAEAEYEVQALQRPVCAGVTLFLYGVATVLILVIVVTQSCSVVKSAGWVS